jgi:DNA-binding Lrp family transcriptional regulator
MGYLNDRQRLILDFLRLEGELTAKEIQAKYDIPTATLYRDIHKLVGSGLASRVHGRVFTNLAVEEGGAPRGGRCLMCGIPTSQRLAFTLEMASGEQAKTCCAHCGLMVLEHNPGVNAAMTADFLFGSMMNVRMGVYLVDSDVQPCCAPSVLAFRRRADAERFQAGFGGRVYEYAEAIGEVRHLMSLHGQHEQRKG